MINASLKKMFWNVVATVVFTVVAYVALVAGALAVGAVGVLVVVTDLYYSIYKIRKQEAAELTEYTVQSIIAGVGLLVAMAVFPAISAMCLAVWVLSRIVSVPTLFAFQSEDLITEIPETEYSPGYKVDLETGKIKPSDLESESEDESLNQAQEVVDLVITDLDGIQSVKVSHSQSEETHATAEESSSATVTDANENTDSSTVAEAEALASAPATEGTSNKTHPKKKK